MDFLSKPEMDRLLKDKTIVESFQRTGRDVAEEIMDTKVGRAPLKMHVRDVVQEFVKLAQALHSQIEATTKDVEKGAQTPVDPKELERLVLKEVQEVWGQDPGAKIFAKMFARGAYIY